MFSVRSGSSAGRLRVLHEASRNLEAAAAALSPHAQHPLSPGPPPEPAVLPVPLLLARRPSASPPSAAARRR